MKLFSTAKAKRQKPQGFATKTHQTFLLEPILTPSGLVDGGDDVPEVGDLQFRLEDFEDTDPVDGNEATINGGFAAEDLEDIDFITHLPGDLAGEVSFQFESGFFTVGDEGQVSIDYLFDGGAYEGELAIFSLEGMEDLDPGSEAFIQEAANRALSGKTQGHVVIDDLSDGARFSGDMTGEGDFNSGDYQGTRTFTMTPGERFGFMLVPNGEVEEVADNPGIGGNKRPLFSLATANPDDMFATGQIADVTGDGNTFVFEDLRTDTGSDRDYNDLVFQVRGATGEATLMDELVADGKDWRSRDLGQALITYAQPPNIVDSIAYDFAIEDQPFVGVLDTGFSSNNPDLDYSRIQLGKDWIDEDNNPLLLQGEGNEHGTHILGLIGATQDNNLGIDGVNDDAPLWVGRAIGSGQWHESLREFVDAAKDSGQPNGVVNLSLDLTQIDGEGNITTRYEFTPQEREAIEYARQNGVLMVVAAGNDGGGMSVLGQAAQEFDNILTVGASDGLGRAAYSSYGNGLGLLALGGTLENPVLSLVEDGIGTMAGTSVATARVTGAVSQVWAANPQLSYRQVIETLQTTATDLEVPGWDVETGAGLLNLAAAVQLAQNTAGEDYIPVPWVAPETWSGEGLITPLERAVSGGNAVDDTQVSYQLTGQFVSKINNAPQPGAGNVPFNTGKHQKTETSNGIVTHYYQNGYLIIQPNGTEVWYALSAGVPSHHFGTTTNEPQKIVTLNSEGSLRDATLLNGGSVDFGDGLARTERIYVKNATIGDGNLNDYYSFNLTDYRQVRLQLLGLTGKVGFSLIKDIDGDGKVGDGEVITDVMSQDGLATASRTRTLSPGKYYVRVFPEDVNAEAISYDLNYKAIPTDADGNGSIPTAKQFGSTVEFGYGNWLTGASGSLSTGDLADYYILQTGKKQEVSLNLEGISEYARLEIIKDINDNGLIESGEVIHASGWGNTERNLLPYLDAGRYYVRVRSSGRATDYKLNVNGRAYYETDIDLEYQDVNNKPRGFKGEIIRIGNTTTDYLKGSTSPQGTSGFWRGYENGSINWSEQYGAVAIWYSMNDLYSSMGGSGSWLGFPKKREYQYLDGRRIDFEGGYIFWQPGRQPKAYKYSEFPNEKPRALVNNMELSTDDFTYGVIDSSIGNEFLFPFNRYVGWSDPDGDAIKAVAFYDPTPDQPVNGKYLGNGTGYWAWPGNLASSVSTPPAPIFKGVRGGVIGVDQLNSIYYSYGKGNTNILDEMAVAVFDGYEWSNPRAFNIRVKPGNQSPVVNVWNQTINESSFFQKTLSSKIGPEWVTNMQGRFSWSDPEGQTIQAVAFYDSSPWNNGTGHFAAPDGTTYSVSKQAPNYRNWFKTTINTKDLDKLYYSHNGNVGITDTVAVSVFDGDKWSQPKEFSIYVKPNNQTSDGPIGSVDIGAEVSDGYLGPVGSINIGVEVLNNQSFSRNFNIINQSLWADDDTQFHFPGFPSKTITLFDEDFFGTQAKLETTTAAYFSLGALDIDFDADFKIHYPSSAKPGEKIKIEIESFLKDGEFDSRVGLSLQAKASLSITRDNLFPVPDTAIKIDASPFSTPVGDINWGISLSGEIAGNSISGTNSNTDYLDGGTINLRPNFTQTSNLEIKGFKFALHSTDEMSAELGEVVYDAKDINLGKSVFEIVIPDNLKTGDTFYLYPRMKPVTELSSKFGFGISSSLELGKINAFGLSKRAIDDLSAKADLEYKDLRSVEINKFDPFDYINGSNGIRSFDWWGEPISIQIR